MEDSRHSRALTHLVGQSRAYLQQLELAKRELRQANGHDLVGLLQAMDAAEAAVLAVNTLGTPKLRASSAD
jgi:hypothetical protein